MIKTFEKFSQLEERVLGVDLDGVLNYFTESFNVIYKKYFPDNIIVPARNIDEWYWYRGLEYDGENADDWFNKHKAETWEVSKPYDGVIEAMKDTYDYTQHNGILLRIVSNQPDENSKKEAVRWLNRYGIKYDDIAFVKRSKDKWDNADVMVDDSPSVLESKPSDKIGIKVIQKWNLHVRSDFNIADIRMLPEIVDDAFEKFREINK